MTVKGGIVALDTLSVILGFAAGFAVTGGVCGFAVMKLREERARLTAELEHGRLARDEMGKAFSLTAQEALQKSSEQFLLLAQERLKAAQGDGAHDLDKRQKAIADLVTPIEKSLLEMQGKIENLGKAGTGLEGQLKTFAEDQRMLRQETQNLVRALRNPAARGRWGEMQLARALEMIGMVEGTHYTQQQNVAAGDGLRRQADFVVRMPGGAEVVIDVKAPVEPYWDAMEQAGSEAGKDAALETFRAKVRDHLKALGSKEYWRLFNSPEFVVMFLPTEGLYSLAVSNDPGLIEEAAKNNVILASPTTLMGLLRVVMHGWQQQHMADESRKVSDLAAELYNRVGKFAEHMQKLGRGLSGALNAYNEAVGSLEHKVLPGARKFKELHVQTGGREIPELGALEESPRALSAPELLEDAGDGEKPGRKRA
jgi:DNA recombination protein RmuC